MKKKRKILIIVIITGSLLLAVAGYFADKVYPYRYISPGSDTLNVSVKSMDGAEVGESELELARGTKVRLRQPGSEESVVEYDGKLITVANSALADSLADSLKTEAVYPRQTLTLMKAKNGMLSDVTVSKGEKLPVTNVDVDDLDPETGMVNWYEVSYGGEKLWVPGKYVESSPEDVKQAEPNAAYSLYWDDKYGEGYSKTAYIDKEDWKKYDVPNFTDNPKKEDVRGIHVQMENLLADPDYYLDLIDNTVLNTLVVEIKNSNGQVMYDSNAVRAFLPDASQAIASNVSMDELKALVEKFQEHGAYMIARLSCFKDPVFAEQFPEESIMGSDGSLLYIADSTWASPYSRKAWQYNGDIAYEAAGIFNEVQLDYMRFPEGLATVQGQFDDRNAYDESKAGAIQSFVAYVRDRVHERHAYLSADVIGQTVTANDDQDMGQYVPGVLISADYASPMAYADHFVQGSMGIDYPWLEQGETMRKFTLASQSVFSDWSQYRPWFQGYANTPQDVTDQINALNELGVSGWLIWDGAGDKASIEAIRPALAG